MRNDDGLPVAQDVVAHLNRRFETLGLSYRVDAIAVLPYVNPMWLANWEVPDIADSSERERIEREIREARWLYPFVL